MDEGPVLRRRRLGGELKRCRQAAGLTQEAVSRHFEWHAAKVTRIETARVAVTPRDVKDLLNLYGVDEHTYRESLIDLARKARERTWWSEYRDVMRSNFVGLEAAATAMVVWEPIVVPGLLQTEQYLRALIRGALPSEPPETVERRVALRLARQTRLTEHQPLRYTAIIDESVLHRLAGDPESMAGQLRRLRDAAGLPNVTLQILPFAAGPHHFLRGPATILEFAGTGHPDVLYLEGFTDSYEDRQDAVARFREEFARITARALDERRSVEMIDTLLRG